MTKEVAKNANQLIDDVVDLIYLLIFYPISAQPTHAFARGRRITTPSEILRLPISLLD